jgi:hypothetical protein
LLGLFKPLDKMKRTWSVFLVMLLTAAPAVVQAQFIYVTNSDGVSVTITGYTGTAGGAAVIPVTTNGLAVTAIGDSAFQGCDLSSLTIPYSITNIGMAPFGGCAGLSITVDPQNPSYSSMNGGLFDKSKTTLVAYQSIVSSYTIPSSVTSIGDGAFAGGNFLTGVTIPGSVTNIGDGAFAGCGLTSVAIPASVTRIGDEAFNPCLSLGSVTIGDGVASIGDWAFEYDDLSSVNIPGSVTNIGVGAFDDCLRLTAITVSATNPCYSSANGVLFDKSQTKLVEYPLGLRNTSYPPGNYTISDSVTGIGDYAFDFCVINSITIPGSVTSIGSNAFHECTLSSVTIPGSVTNIGDEAFANCYKLTAITVSATNPFYSSVNGLLFDKNQAMLIQYPGGMGGSYTISNGVTRIGDEAFYACQSLTSVTIPASVTNIGTNAFYLCDGLQAITVDPANLFYSSVNGMLFDKDQTTLIQCPGGIVGGYTIPSGVTGIEDGAFGGNYSVESTNLTSMAIPGSVTSIGPDMFVCLKGLTNVTIGDGVASVGDEAFVGCQGLSSITIPGSVTSIGKSAFDACIGLGSAYFTGNAPAADTSVFMGTSATVYYLPGTMGWSSIFAGRPAVLWNPVIQTGDGSFGVQNNQFGFNVTGTAGIPIVVEACTNPACPVWTPLTNVTLTNGSFYFSEPAQAGGAGRYYRIGSQ